MFARSTARVLLLTTALICHAADQDDSLGEAARFDSEQKCDDADRIYRQLLAKGSPSPALVNNLGNHRYYTRRADSYPGPGIIPADGRAWYMTLQVKL